MSATYWLHTDEAVFDVPSGFRDMSVQILEWRTSGGGAIGLVVQREDLADGLDLDGYVARTTAEYERTLTGFKLDDVRPMDDAPVPASLLSYRWRCEESLTCQVQGFVQLGRRIILVTATAKPPLRGEAEALVVRSITSMRLRER